MTLPAPDPAFHWTSEPWGHALRCRPLRRVAQHLFTSRQLALPRRGSVGAALASVGATPDRLMRVKQVHGNVVRVLNEAEVPADAAEQRPDGDAIVSNEPGLALAVMVADCVPILLVDPHAARPRRFTPAGAARARAWRRRRSTRCSASSAAIPADLIAAIGPSVGPDDYEVGESLVEAFLEAGPSAVRRRSLVHSRRRQASPRSVGGQPRSTGRRRASIAARIFICGLSTVSHPDVFRFVSRGRRTRRPHGRPDRRPRSPSRQRYRLSWCYHAPTQEAGYGIFTSRVRSEAWRRRGSCGLGVRNHRLRPRRFTGICQQGQARRPARRHGRPAPIRLSSNENLRGPSPRCIEALKAPRRKISGSAIRRPASSAFPDAIAAMDGAKPNNVIDRDRIRRRI